MSSQSPGPHAAEEIERWLVSRLATLLAVPPSDVARDEPLVSLGADSMQVVVLVGELEDWLGCRIAVNPLVDYPTIHSLSQFLSQCTQAGIQVIDASVIALGRPER